MSHKPRLTNKLDNTVSTQIKTDIPPDLLKKAKALHVNLEAIIQQAAKSQADLTEIEQQITNACNYKSRLIYNNLIDNYPMTYKGIRDCYKNSM